MSDEQTQLSLRDLVDLEAWLDESFRDEVLANPGAAAAKVAEKYGVELPAGVQFSAVSDSETQYNLVLSANPAGDAPAASASEVRAYGMELMGAPRRIPGGEAGQQLLALLQPGHLQGHQPYGSGLEQGRRAGVGDLDASPQPAVPQMQTPLRHPVRALSLAERSHLARLLRRGRWDRRSRPPAGVVGAHVLRRPPGALLPPPARRRAEPPHGRSPSGGGRR